MYSTENSKIVDEAISSPPNAWDADFALRIALHDELTITWGGVISQKPGDTLGQFTPDSDFALFFVNQGTMSLTVDGQPYVINKGQTLITTRVEKLAGAAPNSEPLLCQWLCFCIRPHRKCKNDFTIEVPRITKPGASERIAELIRMITDEYHTANRPNAPVFKPFYGRGTQLLLFSLLARLGEAEPQDLSKSDALTALAEHGKDYIRMNSLGPLSTADVAKALDCSARYLRKAFQNTFGYSPSSYILKTRLMTARSYLINSRMPISEIARKCGFKNQNYFTRVFRANEGVTPSQFRIAHSHRYTVPNI